MRTPRSLAGRVAVLSVALALLVGGAVGLALALRPSTSTTSADPSDSEPFTPMTFEGPVIARVDGSPIFLEEAELRIAGIASLHGDVEETMGEDWPGTILGSLVEDQLLQAEAVRQGIVVTKGQVADSLNDVREMAGSPEAFQQWLTEQGLTLEALERRIWLQTLTGAVYTAVTADVRVTGDELREYYRANREAYTGVDGSVLPFITVRSSLRSELAEARKNELFAAWLEETRSEADVELLMKEWWREVE